MHFPYYSIEKVPKVADGPNTIPFGSAPDFLKQQGMEPGPWQPCTRCQPDLLLKGKFGALFADKRGTDE